MADSALKIGFLGTGRMATALASGFAAELGDDDRILGFDVASAAADQFAQQTGGAVCSTLEELVGTANVLVLAVKPQHIADVLDQVAGLVTNQHLVVSIAAGVRLEVLQQQLGERIRVVRVMPNTPALIGAGAAGYSAGSSATADDVQLVARLLATTGVAHAVPENLLDVVTGLSGSGPAYVYQFIEALSDGGVCAGLPRAIATELAAQTVLGAAQMVLQTGQHPGELKDAVASPGGTTIAGLFALEQGGLRGTVMEAVLAAAQRSAELG